MSKTHVITLNIPPDLLSRLNAYCRNNGISRAAFIRELIAQELRNEKPS